MTQIRPSRTTDPDPILEKKNNPNPQRSDVRKMKFNEKTYQTRVAAGREFGNSGAGVTSMGKSGLRRKTLKEKNLVQLRVHSRLSAAG